MWYNTGMASDIKIDREHLKPVPVGDSDWADFSQKSYTVDKTLLIKEILDDNTKVALFTRPRRFGKTTALRMLKTFFEKASKDTSYLFKDLKIWAAGEKYRAEQGKYPVIYLTFKDCVAENWETALEKLKMQIAAMVGDHVDALTALKNPEEQCRLDSVWRERGNVSDLGASLGLLAKALHLQSEAAGGDVRPIILIDEYDAPVNSASTNGYLETMTAFMRSFLSGAMKDNEHVRMGVMTGVLRVAKEGILSGLNNLRVWTVFDGRYAEYFGFLEDEVAAMAAYYGASSKMPEIKSWYDGYDFGGTEIYNPWSVLNYFGHDCVAKPFWLDTSSNDVIADIVRDLPHDTAETLEKLLRDGRALVRMTQELGPYAQIRNEAETLYALLVSSGYLKVVPSVGGEDVPDGYAWVSIPNRELEKVFVGDVVSKVRRYSVRGESDVALAIFNRDPAAFRMAIQHFLADSVSYYDGSEAFYHGMTLGFLAVLRNRYRVRSNREAGDGRFDIALTPLVRGFPGVIIEVKAARSARQSLKRLAQEARAQIDRKSYEAEMVADGLTDILKLGLAFHKKRVALAVDRQTGFPRPTERVL